MGTVLLVFGVEPFRIGGTETYARELARQLEGVGWKTVFGFQGNPPEDVRRFLTLPNVTIESLPEDFTELSWKGLSGVSSLLRRYRPEILHLHFTGFVGMYPWLARLSSVKKVFFTDQTSRPAGYIQSTAPLWKRAAVRVINFPITRVICVSEYGRQCLNTLQVLPSDRYSLIYNAVDRSRVGPDESRGCEFKKRHSIPEDRVVVVQVSWIIPEKGIPQLLKVARLVLSRCPDVQFVLVGEGAYREQYMKDAKEMGIDDHVTWTGLVQDPFGEGVFEAADIVSQLSDWEEVFGWMIAEGMAHSKPLVATKVGGIPELVTNGQTGYVVERNDIETTAQLIETLVRDPELRRRMGKAGFDKVAEKFDLTKTVRQLIEAYDIQCVASGEQKSR